MPDPTGPYEPPTTLQGSADGGVTWEEVDLGPAGLSDGKSIVSYDGGALGLALVVGDEGGPESVAFTADLASWTVTPLADLAGDLSVEGGYAQPYVGADRVLVTALESEFAGDEPSRSRTAVGTPRR
jgi:hypothetical protein